MIAGRLFAVILMAGCWNAPMDATKRILTITPQGERAVTQGFNPAL